LISAVRRDSGEEHREKKTMKKLLMVCVLALGVLAVSSQPASAWSKFRASIGASISYDGSGNCLLWGAARGAPLPGHPYLPQGYFGSYLPGGCCDYGAYPCSQPVPVSTGDKAKVTPVEYWYGQGNQPVSYYYSGAGYGVPSYWYGR
jgi:hypothetical protein